MFNFFKREKYLTKGALLDLLRENNLIRPLCKQCGKGLSSRTSGTGLCVACYRKTERDHDKRMLKSERMKLVWESRNKRNFEIYRLYVNDKYTYRELAHIYGISPQRVEQIVKKQRNGVVVKAKPTSKRHFFAPYLVKRNMEMYDAYTKGGASISELTEKYKLNKVTIYKIIGHIRTGKEQIYDE